MTRSPRAPLAPLAPNASLRWDVVRRELPHRRARVLEVGCGQGGFGSRIAARHDYTAVEIDAASWAVADARVRAVDPGARVLHGSVSALRPTETFDVVCAFEVLEHLEDDAGALAEWAARVRPGGVLLLSVPAWPARFGPWDTLAGHFRRYEPAALAGLLRGAGLVDAHVRVYGAPLGYLLEAVRDRTVAAAGRHGPTASDSMTERTSGSGRKFQPSTRMTGTVIAVGTWPFRLLQRAFPRSGTGLVARARQPQSSPEEESP
ncbi:class I SAM-dependent methyltransferase [Isoptericola cucumis]|uniref:Methyltransferase type 11 n=1 Tax=Isoptericola cucumis TaxID=1776856 RepID=A0ABQ2BB28_9MICO|nr:class I SAM-dependent methyltransferase [Isoptericola cucumis]GGI09817.1 hypothetical protein GCM10007368_28090 [Isoptericola cucumis]